MIRCFELTSEQIKIKNVLSGKPFLEIELYPISNQNPNRNDACFTLESMQKGLPEFIDKPIVGFFSGEDFEGHKAKMSHDRELDREYWDNEKGEQILGFMRQSDSREIIEKDGLSWIRCSAMIYTKYNYKQVKRLLKDKQKKVSVEVIVKKSEVINDIEYIYEFELIGITILGSKFGRPILEGVQGAHLSVLDMMDEIVYNNQREALVFAYQGLNINEKEVNDLIDEKTVDGTEEDNVPNTQENNTQTEEVAGQIEENAAEPIAENLETNSDKTEPVAENEEKTPEGGIKDEKKPEEKKPDETVKDSELQLQYDALIQKCSVFEQEITNYKEICANHEATIANYAAENAKFKDYDTIKTALESANMKLMSIQLTEQKNHIIALMSAKGLTENDVKEVKEKCERREFSDLVGIDKEIAYIIYQKDQNKSNSKPTAPFSVNITEEPLSLGSNRKSKTIAERLKENIKK